MVPRKYFSGESFNVTQLPYYGYHHMWPMREIQDCNVTLREFRETSARTSRESGLGLEGKTLFSLNYCTFIRTPSVPTLSYSRSLLLSLFQSVTLSICHYLTLSLSHSLSLSPTLSPTLSLLLFVCLYFSLSLSLFLLLSLNELDIRNMHGDGSAKVSRKFFFS